MGPRHSPVAGVGYVVVQTEKIDAWCTFAGSLLGMMSSALALPAGARAFRMDDRMARFILAPGPDSVAAVGWDVAGLPEWEDLLSRLDKAGVQTESVPTEQARQRAAAEVCRASRSFRQRRRIRAAADDRSDQPLRLADGSAFRHR